MQQHQLRTVLEEEDTQLKTHFCWFPKNGCTIFVLHSHSISATTPTPTSTPSLRPTRTTKTTQHRPHRIEHRSCQHQFRRLIKTCRVMFEQFLNNLLRDCHDRWASWTVSSLERLYPDCWDISKLATILSMDHPKPDLRGKIPSRQSIFIRINPCRFS